MLAEKSAAEPITDNDEHRFAFGENWRNFLSLLNEERIAQAEKSLREMLGLEDFRGKSFLDIGSGSGLFSLAAKRLGALVTSFDYDPNSVGCAQELKSRYFGADPDWRVEQGSALDRDYMKTLGAYDVVYSWGVLHHTGAMWEGLENATVCTKPGGLLFISLYNDEGWRSEANRRMKKFYNRLPAFLKPAMAAAYVFYEIARGAAIDLLRLKDPFARHREKINSRGMAVWHDALDWLGGYPYEVAKPGDVFDFYHARGFELVKLNTVPRGHGCNEFVFRRRG
ncbi:MAG: class I SAM-dependent methyltransferase [Alphaproteobacteria bacterium]|nr:class I SAM-dependent methyltransferase [Alphaproteobacteria bacterium]